MLCLFGLGVQSVQGMSIFVKISSETTITLEVEPSDTVDNVKQKIQDQQEISQSQQILFFETIKLEDIGILNDYNIKNGDTLVLITIHNIISLASGTEFNIKTGTVLGAEGLDLIPSSDFSLISSLSGSDAVSNSTAIAHINKSFRFSETTAGYSGLVKLSYLETDLNSLSANGLKLLYNNGNSWAIDDNSTNNSTDKYSEVTLTNKMLNELSLGNCTITDAPIVACYQTATWNPATCQYDITGTQGAAPAASAQTFCASKTVADLTATGTNLKWYDLENEGTALATSTALATATYYVSQTDNGCESARTAVTITVNTTAVPIASAQTFCASGTVADLTATGTNLKWYDLENEGTALASSTALATATYYVSQTDNGCESARTAVTITVNTPATPIASAQTFCASGTVADLTAIGTNLKWYDLENEGTALASSTALATATYYVSQTVGTCESSRTALVLTLTPQPLAPTLACYEVATWNGLTCQYDITGTKPETPTTLTSDQTATWNALSCLYDITTNQLNVPNGLTTIAVKFNAVLYPNPFSTNFKLDLTTSSYEKVNLNVYDLTGRLIEVHNIDVSEIANQEMGNNYQSGVYTIILTQDLDVKILRVIKR